MATFEEMKEALAACLNGVKGEVNTLDRKRGREDCLHSSLDMARIDRATLEAMIEAIKDALPMFRDYFRAKAKLLGTEKLPWWSLFAPVGSVDKTYTFEEAKDLILSNFASFSQEMADFAQTPSRKLDRRPAAPRQTRRRLLYGNQWHQGKPHHVQL